MNNLYGDIIEIDKHRHPVYPDVIVAYRSGKKIGVLRGIDSLVNSNHLMEAAELSFDLHKELNGVACDLWDDVKDFRLIYVPALDSSDFNPWYELHVTIDEYDETVKHCECYHIQETELSQLSLHDIEINTEKDIDRSDYVPTKIYNESNPDGSLLDRLLKDKASHYTIHHVDGSLANLQRTFSWGDTDIKTAFDEIAEEIEGVFIYGLSTLDDGKIHRTISLYDLNDVCLDCGERGTFTDGVCTKCGSTNIKQGYGLDSGIFINAENFASTISYSSNVDEVKNCFRFEAGDDVMTAAIRNINPTLSQYIWYFSDDTRADMSPELQSELAAYDEAYEAYETTEELEISQADVDAYNTLVNKYSAYDSTLRTVSYPIIGYSNLTDFYYKTMELRSLLQTKLAPNSPSGEHTTAAIEAAKLTSATLSPMGIQNAAIASAATVNSAVTNYAKVYFDSSLYGLTIKSSNYNSSTHIWTGVLTLTSYVDNEDTADTSSITISVTGATTEYLKTLLEKTMKKNGKDATGTVALFKLNDTDFANALSGYSVDNLSMFAQIDRACLDVLIDQGCATEGSSLWADTYNNIYMPYYRKSVLLENELTEREIEVNTLDGILDDIDLERKRIASELDLRAYIGETLWIEFCSFRRDDDYKNENFISDGLNDEEIVENAEDFLKRAKRDLIKSATLQHTISCNLNDLLLYTGIDLAVHENKYEYVVDSNNNIIVTSDREGIVIFQAANETIFINNHVYTIDKNSIFYPLLSYFKVGNWIRVEIDGKIYKLRMTDYTVTYDDLQTIEVEFSDVTYALGSMSDIQSVLSKSKSMATSYSTTARQAGNGQKANMQIVNMIENGLYLTNKKIANADNQNLLIDEYGMLVRQIGEYTNDYLPEQVKIINKGLYFTADNWLTAKAAIGAFQYYDPDSGTYKDGYGVIAEKVIGNLILGNDLGIYNESGSLKVDENGVVITAYPNADNSDLFVIRKDNGNGTYTKFLYMDSSGTLNMELGGTNNSVLKVYDSNNRVITSIDRSNFYIQSYSGNNTQKLDLLSGALRVIYNDTYHGGVHNVTTSNLQGINIAGLHTVGLSISNGSTATNYYRLADDTAIANSSSCAYRHNFYGSMGSVFSNVSLKASNNNVSSNTGLGYGIADINGYNVGVFEVIALSNGNTQTSMRCYNRNTSGTQTAAGSVSIVTTKSGSMSFTSNCDISIQKSSPVYMLQATNLNVRNATFSANAWYGCSTRDTNGHVYGAWYAAAYTDGRTGSGLWAYNFNTSGTQVGSGGLIIMVDKSGTVSYSVSNAAAFRTAIACAASSHAHGAGDITSGTLAIDRGGTGTTTGIKGWTAILSNITTTTAQTINISSYTDIAICAAYSTSYRSCIVIPRVYFSTTLCEHYLGGWGNNSTSSNRRAWCKMSTTQFQAGSIRIDGTDYTGSWYVYGR